MSGAYKRLKPIHRLFVDGLVAGQNGTQVMRRLRPDLKRPDVRAAKWKARADVQAALAERQPQTWLGQMAYLERRVLQLEEQVARLQATVARGTAEAVRDREQVLQ